MAQLQLKIGTFVNGYVLAAVIGLVVFLFVVAIGLVELGSHSNGTSGPEKLLKWSAGAGDAITFAQYRAMNLGTAEGTVRARLGSPASHGPAPGVASEQCVGYRGAAGNGTLFTFCFSSRGLLVSKKKY